MNEDKLDKVIECIDKCTTQKVKLYCNDCPYHNLPVETDCFDILMRDALELLKEQQTKIDSAKEIAIDERTNATWRDDYEAWKVLDRIAEILC